ncbi:hypothetical protein J437_LFUL012902, partial [Ladona fulva]
MADCDIESKALFKSSDRDIAMRNGPSTVLDPNGALEANSKNVDRNLSDGFARGSNLNSTMFSRMTEKKELGQVFESGRRLKDTEVHGSPIGSFSNHFPLLREGLSRPSLKRTAAGRQRRDARAMYQNTESRFGERSSGMTVEDVLSYYGSMQRREVQPVNYPPYYQQMEDHQMCDSSPQSSSLVHIENMVQSHLPVSHLQVMPNTTNYRGHVVARGRGRGRPRSSWRPSTVQSGAYMRSEDVEEIVVEVDLKPDWAEKEETNPLSEAQKLVPDWISVIPAKTPAVESGNCSRGIDNAIPPAVSARLGPGIEIRRVTKKAKGVGDQRRVEEVKEMKGDNHAVPVLPQLAVAFPGISFHHAKSQRGFMTTSRPVTQEPEMEQITVKTEPENLCVFRDEQKSAEGSVADLVRKPAKKSKEDDVFVCDLCGRSFSERYCLARHIHAHHVASCDNADKRAFPCSVCYKSFTRKANLKKHMRIHSGEKPYVCEECGRAFTFSKNLKQHIRVHGVERPFVCEVCGHAFRFSKNLSQHRGVHAHLKPHQCNVCGRSFTRSTHLSQHLRLHSGEKPFRCSVCGKCFAQRGHAALHTRVHTGERPYCCSVCKRSFSLRAHLVRHMALHQRDGDAGPGRPPPLPRRDRKGNDGVEVIAKEMCVFRDEQNSAEGSVTDVERTRAEKSKEMCVVWCEQISAEGNMADVERTPTEKSKELCVFRDEQKSAEGNVAKKAASVKRIPAIKSEEDEQESAEGGVADVERIPTIKSEEVRILNQISSVDNCTVE